MSTALTTIKSHPSTELRADMILYICFKQYLMRPIAGTDLRLAQGTCQRLEVQLREKVLS